MSIFRISRDWVFLYDGEIDLTNATTDEVADMRWMTVEEIRQLYDSVELVHTLMYFFDDPELGGLNNGLPLHHTLRRMLRGL